MSLFPTSATTLPETKTIYFFWNVPPKSGQWEVEQMNDGGIWAGTGLFTSNNSANIRSSGFGFDGSAPLFQFPRLTQRP